MKGKLFCCRLKFAWNGLRAAFRNEASFRTEVFAATAAIVFTTWLNPPLLWFALVIVMIALILASELFNTALEHTLDKLHPEQAPFVRLAKDCAAAAVMVLSVCSVIVFLLMLVEVYA